MGSLVRGGGGKVRSMPLSLPRIRSITVDARNPYTQAQFWAAALGFVEDPRYPNAPEDPEALIIDPQAHHPRLLFMSVPEPKAVKNRLHLDLQPHDGREAAVARLQELGARVIDDRRQPDGPGWVVMADPEGNEFCVERSPAERGDPAPPRTADAGPAIAAQRTEGEGEMLAAMLDWSRDTVLRKVKGTSPACASAVPFSSASSIAGIVKHLALVEDSWFTERFAGRPTPEPWVGIDWDADPDWEFHSATSEPPNDLIAQYQAACERSRAVTAEHDLDDLAADTSRPPFNLRFVLLHMLEETARHAGHLDVLREHLDGTIGA